LRHSAVVAKEECLGLEQISDSFFCGQEPVFFFIPVLLSLLLDVMPLSGSLAAELTVCALAVRFLC